MVVVSWVCNVLVRESVAERSKSSGVVNLVEAVEVEAGKGMRGRRVKSLFYSA